MKTIHKIIKATRLPTHQSAALSVNWINEIEIYISINAASDNITSVNNFLCSLLNFIFLYPIENSNFASFGAKHIMNASARLGLLIPRFAKSFLLSTLNLPAKS